MKHYIQLIGFDGKSYWRLFYVEIYDNKDVYYGLIRKKVDLSFSRHGSGIVHIKSGKEKKRMEEIMPNFKLKKPLYDIDSNESLGGTFFPISSKEKISEEEYHQYFSKKCEGIFLIDLRNFKGTMNLQPFLINPNKKDFLITHDFKQGCQLYIYTASKPWVAFYILDVISKNNS